MTTKEVSRKTVAERIAHLEPCSEAIKWANQYTSPAKAWRECERGDWMLWILGHQSGEPESASRRQLVACAADCAELALPIFEAKYPGDKRVRNCIAACRAWSRGEITMEALRNAANAANVAYVAANAANAANVAYAANAAYAAANAANAAYAANAARTQLLADCAGIVRKHYPKPPTIKKPEKQ